VKASALCIEILEKNFFFSRSQHDRSDLIVKKLRYYARFIVVCLLLKKMKLVRDLVRELSKNIGNFTLNMGIVVLVLWHFDECKFLLWFRIFVEYN
jgi:Protein SCAI